MRACARAASPSHTGLHELHCALERSQAVSRFQSDGMGASFEPAPTSHKFDIYVAHEHINRKRQVRNSQSSSAPQ